MAADRDDQPNRWADLPAPVRSRLLALAAEALGQVPSDQLPAQLRRFARFTPHKRARLAATALRAALEEDAVFRLHVAEQVPDPAGAAPAEAPTGAARLDPVAQLAELFLRRPTGWNRQLDELASRLEPEPDEAASAVAGAEAAEITRLTDRLHAERSQARAERAAARAEVAELKAANVRLRRTLKSTRDRLAAAEAERDQLRADLDAAAGDRQHRDAAHAAATRRLKARLDDALAANEAERRSARAGRDAHNARLRLLLETIRSAAAGLGQELALPASDADVAPADTVEMRTVGTSARSMADVGGDAARLLGEMIALPHSHLIVDGYNVTKTAWPTLPLADQRRRLVTGLGAVARRARVEITCVFDGADLLSVPTVPIARGVRVRFSPAGVTADDVIRALVDAEPAGRVVLVATSDAEIVADVRRAGATAVPAEALVQLLTHGRS